MHWVLRTALGMKWRCYEKKAWERTANGIELCLKDKVRTRIFSLIVDTWVKVQGQECHST